MPAISQQSAQRPDEWLEDFYANNPGAFAAYAGGQIDYPHLTKLSSMPEIVSHVEGVVDHFQESGLSREDYLAVVAAEPGLLLHKSSQVIDRIEEVLKHFRADQKARTAYVCALTDYPALFRAEPKAAISAIEQTDSPVQSLMRHSDIRLTMSVYTDPKHLDTAAAIESLPSVAPASATQSNSASSVAPIVAPTRTNSGATQAR